MIRNRGHHHFDKLTADDLSGGYLHENPGRTFYVNNVTGNAAKNGRSWALAVAQPNEAIALSEAYRKAHATSNVYIRNKIVVQATLTPYDAITHLPSYCDLIGLGANAWGNGKGIVVVGFSASKDGANSPSDDYSFGVHVANIQLQGCGGSGYQGLDCYKLYQAIFEDCFIGASSENAVTDLNAGVRATNNFSGNIFRHNIIGATHGAKRCTHGFDLSGGGVMDGNLFEDNIINAITTGIKNPVGANDGGTIWRRNTICSGYGAILTKGIVAALYGKYIENFIIAGTPISDHDSRQYCGNTEVTS